MKIDGNLVIADQGKALKTPNGIFEQVTLGVFEGFENGKQYIIENKLEDITEVSSVRILDDIYYVESKEYGDIVSELIRKKYSLDQELALYANSYITDNSEAMNKYQDWRVLCKEAAKKIS